MTDDELHAYTCKLWPIPCALLGVDEVERIAANIYNSYPWDYVPPGKAGADDEYYPSL